MVKLSQDHAKWSPRMARIAASPKRQTALLGAVLFMVFALTFPGRNYLQSGDLRQLGLVLVSLGFAASEARRALRR